MDDTLPEQVLLAHIEKRSRHLRRPLLVLMSGLPGSGKSTLANKVIALAKADGLEGMTMSLDDFYLPRSARLALAHYIHPLLLTRGVPGTHDMPLLWMTLDALQAPIEPQQPVWIPRFDKGRDTRHEPQVWDKVTATPDFIIMEGWCLGVAPQSEKQLLTAINDLEAKEDKDASWRRRANTYARQYLHLWQQADTRVLIKVPDWQTVRTRRRHAELERRQAQAQQAMDDAAIERFLMHYERLGREILKHPPTALNFTFQAAHLT